MKLFNEVALLRPK